MQQTEQSLDQTWRARVPARRPDLTKTLRWGVLPPVELSDHDRALGFARTMLAMPAIPFGALQLQESGVRDIPLQLWLEPEDLVPPVMKHPELCVPMNPLLYTWQLWQQLPASIAICTAAICFLSAVAVGLFAP